MGKFHEITEKVKEEGAKAENPVQLKAVIGQRLLMLKLEQEKLVN